MNNTVYLLMESGINKTAPELHSNTIDIIMRADPLLQLTLLILVVFSVISWSIIFYKYRFLKQAAKESNIFIDSFWRTEKLEEAFQIVDKYPSAPVAYVFRAGYTELKRLLSDHHDKQIENSKKQNSESLEIASSGIDNVTRALRRAGTSQITLLESKLPFLATCGSTAPFIGLFGTVWGILQAFQKIGVTGSASIATVGPSISEALIATAVGLFAAIPAVIAYNYFLTRVRLLSADMETFSSDFLNIVKRNFFKG